jgi:pantothenate synthetase
VHPETLAPWRAGERTLDRAVAAIACRIGTTRLIDNRQLGARGS